MVSSTETGEFSGGVRVRGGRDDPAAPPHEGEERRGLWSPRRKPGSLFGGDLGAGGTPHRAHAGVGLVWSQQIWLWVPVELRPVDRNGWIGARRKG